MAAHSSALSGGVKPQMAAVVTVDGLYQNTSNSYPLLGLITSQPLSFSHFQCVVGTK